MDNIRKYEDITKAYLDNLQAQRMRFHAGEKIEQGAVSDLVLNSWERSRSLGASELYNPVFVSKDQLVMAQEKNSLLLECAMPIIESIYSSLAGYGNTIGISDANGLILYSINDKHICRTRLCDSETGLISNEECLGTNGYGTCLAEKKVVEIIGAEHYSLDAANWYCIGAPIFDYYNNIVGVINLSTNLNNMQIYTSGIIPSLSLAISNHIKSRHSSKIYMLMANSIDEAAIVVNNSGNVIHHNNASGKMLGISENSNIRNIFFEKEVIDDILPAGKECNEIELTFIIGNKKIQGLFSSRAFS